MSLPRETYLPLGALSKLANDVASDARKNGARINRSFVNGWLRTNYDDARLDEMATGALITGKTLQAFLVDKAGGERRRCAKCGNWFDAEVLVFKICRSCDKNLIPE